MFDLTAEEARCLLNIALMAIGRNRFKSAAKILAVLEAFRPNRPEVATAKAVALLSAMDFQGCIDFLDGVALKAFPKSAMLLAFKGMAYLRLGMKEEAQEVLQIAAASTEDVVAARMARDLLA